MSVPCPQTILIVFLDCAVSTFHFASYEIPLFPHITLAKTEFPTLTAVCDAVFNTINECKLTHVLVL